jgi:hypothetical protein
MKKDEMVSLNQELFSLEGGNLTVEELDRRLELAMINPNQSFICGTFGCYSFGNCGSFGCGTFTTGN